MSDRLDADPDVAEPSVSVILPTFNSAATVERALRSVRLQAGVSYEIIVVDDCSTDDTVKVVRQLGWPDIRLLRRSTNGGPGAARNDALKAAKGQFVAFLDADDEWLPEKLLRQLESFRAHRGATLSATDCALIYPDGRHILYYSGVPLPDCTPAWKIFLERNCVVTSTVLCRREDVLRLGGFREELRYGEDLDLWIRMARQGELCVVRDVLARWHFQPTGLTATLPSGDLSFVLPMIREHLDQIGPELSQEERRCVLGHRHFDTGYGLYRSGHAGAAAPLFRRSFQLGWRRRESALMFLACVARGALQWGLKRKPGATGSA